uniref:mucin-21-like isoform X1 n=1 Tax=Myxine glutinosa TaxID=7769 RepID=UPI00358F5010
MVGSLPCFTALGNSRTWVTVLVLIFLCSTFSNVAGSTTSAGTSAQTTTQSSEASSTTPPSTATTTSFTGTSTGADTTSTTTSIGAATTVLSSAQTTAAPTVTSTGRSDTSSTGASTGSDGSPSGISPFHLATPFNEIVKRETPLPFWVIFVIGPCCFIAAVLLALLAGVCSMKCLKT